MSPQRSHEDWRRVDRRVIWHPFTQMRDWQREPAPVIVRAEGFHLIDVDGRRYIDGHASLWVNVFGHGAPRIAEAIGRQARELDHSTMLGLSNVPAIAFAEALLARAPEGLTRVFYSDNGSTAMEVALKMAFQYWQLRGEDRRRFVTFSGAYHGDTIGTVSLGAIELYHARFKPLLFEVLETPWPRPYRDPEHRDDPAACGEAALAALDRLLAAHAGEVAGLAIESGIQGADGMHTAPPGFMKGVETLCRKHGVLLMVDEVLTGFGRSGKLWAVDHEGVRPDIMALSKGITGGTLPLGVTLTREEIYEAFLGQYSEFKTFFHGHSYTGNPIACAAALATLETFDETRLLDALPDRVAHFRRELEGLADHPHVGEIRQFGMMVGIELVADRERRDTWPIEWRVPHRIVRAAQARGAIIRPLGHVMTLVPAPAMPAPLLTELVAITREAIDEVTRAPEPTSGAGGPP